MRRCRRCRTPCPRARPAARGSAATRAGSRQAAATGRIPYGIPGSRRSGSDRSSSQSLRSAGGSPRKNVYHSTERSRSRTAKPMWSSPVKFTSCQLLICRGQGVVCARCPRQRHRRAVCRGAVHRVDELHRRESDLPGGAVDAAAAGDLHEVAHRLRARIALRRLKAGDALGTRSRVDRRRAGVEVEDDEPVAAEDPVLVDLLVLGNQRARSSSSCPARHPRTAARPRPPDPPPSSRLATNATSRSSRRPGHPQHQRRGVRDLRLSLPAAGDCRIAVGARRRSGHRVAECPCGASPAPRRRARGRSRRTCTRRARSSPSSPRASRSRISRTWRL